MRKRFRSPRPTPHLYDLESQHYLYPEGLRTSDTWVGGPGLYHQLEGPYNFVMGAAKKARRYGPMGYAAYQASKWLVKNKLSWLFDEDSKGYEPPSMDIDPKYPLTVRPAGKLALPMSGPSFVKNRSITNMGYKSSKRLVSRARKRKRTRAKRKSKMLVSRRGIKQMINNKIHVSPKVHEQFYDTGYITTNANECAYGVYPYFTTAINENICANHGPFMRGATSIDNQPDLNYSLSLRPYDQVKLEYTKGTKVCHLIRNNDLIDVDVFWYEYVCTDDTDKTWLTQFEAAAHQKRKVSTAVANDITFSPMHCPKQMSPQWKRLKCGGQRLKPGQEMIVKVCPGRAWFSPYADYKKSSSANDFQKQLTKVLVVRIQGTLGHDTATRANVGKLKCALDYEVYCDQHYRFHKFLSQGYNVADKRTDTITIGEQSNVEVAQENPE